MQIRRSAQRVKKEIKNPLIVAEIGVREGNNAIAILNEMDIKTLFLVDPYLSYDDGGRIYSSKEQYEIMIKMIEKLKGFPQIMFLFQKAETAVNLFPDKYFDYVYIDGDHSYEGVKKDLELWHMKVKARGILAGHDYNSTVAWPGVTRAVNEFAERGNLSVVDCKDSDWYIEL